MKSLRYLLSVLVVVLLTVGYFLSQLAALSGTAEQYATKIDCPPVQWLALFVLLVCLVLAFVRDEEADEK